MIRKASRKSLVASDGSSILVASDVWASLVDGLKPNVSWPGGSWHVWREFNTHCIIWVSLVVRRIEMPMFSWLGGSCSIWLEFNTHCARWVSLVGRWTEKPMFSWSEAGFFIYFIFLVNKGLVSFFNVRPIGPDVAFESVWRPSPKSLDLMLWEAFLSCWGCCPNAKRVAGVVICWVAWLLENRFEVFLDPKVSYWFVGIVKK